MPSENNYYWELLEELDNMDRALTDWEVNFIESVLQQGTLSAKQKIVIDKMKEKYLV